MSPAVECQCEGSITSALTRPDEMIAIKVERCAFDVMESPCGEDECGTGSTDFLTNLTGELAIGIDVLPRE